MLLTEGYRFSMAVPFDPRGRSEGPSPSGFPAPVSHEPRPSGLTYEPFYGLREKPFSLTSDSRFFYQSRSHAPAFDDLLNAIRRRESLNVLTGDIGTGKTTLCRAVLESLDRKTFSAFVPDPFASREELLKVLLTDFGVASVDDVTSGRLRGATRTELSYLLYEFLSTLTPLQACAVVFIDEAQNLSQQLLEEVRILSDADGQLQIVLVGQLELRERLKLPEMRQLDQRVSVHCRLQPLDLAGVAGYISHRLHVAGGSSDRVRFTGEAVEAIYLLSGGVPRIINRLCDRALRYGYSKREAEIDAGIVQDANPEPQDREVTFASTAMAPPPPIAAPPVIAAPPPAPPPAIAPPSATTPIAAPPPAAVAPVVVVPLPAVPAVATPAPSEPVAPAPIDPPAPLPSAPPPVAVQPPAAMQPVVSAVEPVRLIAPASVEPPQAAAVATAEPQQTRPQLADNLENWLMKIETQPDGPALDLDWRQRWHATNAVAAPPSERRSGVRVRIPGAGAQPYTQAERVSRRWLRRMFWATVALVLVLGALIAGPASIAASLEIWSQIDEQFTPPPPPPLPARVRLRVAEPLRAVPPPAEQPPAR